MHFDLLIRGGACVLPWGEEATDVGVRDGRIAAIGATRSDTAETTIDAAGLHVLPGLIDSHVHLRDPGDPAIESLATGTKAAVLGGITAVFDMPNTNPPIADHEQLAWKQGYAEQNAWCDVGLYVAGAKTNIQDLAGLELEGGVCAIKVFAGSSTSALMVEDDEHLEKIMRAGRRRIAFHSEDEYRLQARKPMFHVGMPHRNHMEWRDVECAFLGTRRLMALARKTGRPAHILHVSTAEELEYLRDFRDVATVEVLVNHLTQVAPDCYDRLGGFGVMNPPIRDERHRAASWAAVRNGTVDTIGSDHAPHSRVAKQKPWPECPAGLTGVQTLVPIMLDHVNAGRLSLARLADLMAAGPARVYGLIGKGRLAAGYDADFTLVDMKKTRTIEDSWIASPCGWTPFAGMAVSGWPVATIIRGSAVMREDEVLGGPVGRLARFQK
jgi:dihydroorotase